MNITPTKQSMTIPHDESILVIKRSHLFNHAAAFQGLSTDNIEGLLNIIISRQEFLPRSLMEQDPTYKQIIPYLVFRYNDRYFLMQRKSSASEQRLKNKFTLGIGGHMRQEDMRAGTSIFDWARREFYEEVAYSGELKITTLGFINDDSNEVGKVHLGIALLVEGDSTDIAIKSELKQGMLVTLDECGIYFDRLETWSQILYQYLIKRN